MRYVVIWIETGLVLNNIHIPMDLRSEKLNRKDRDEYRQYPRPDQSKIIERN